MAQAFTLCVILPLAGPLISIFPVSAETARMAWQMIHVLCGGIWLNAFNTIVIVSVLRTGGDVGAAAAIDVGSLWLIGVPAACVAGFAPQVGDIAFVYLATYLEQIFKAFVALRR